MKPLQYWEFLTQLNLSIERLVAHSRFKYGSKPPSDEIDYAGAIKRYLYATAVNDPWLRTWFAKAAGSNSAPKFVFSTFELSALSREILAGLGMDGVKVIGLPSRNWLVKLAYRSRLVLRIRNGLKKKSANSAYASLENDRQIGILAFSHQRKFVGALKAVLERTGASYAFVVGHGEEMAEFGLQASETTLMPAGTIGNIMAEGDWPEIHYLANRIEAAIQKYRPKLLVYCEGDAWYQDLVSCLGIKHGVPSICIQWGAFPYPEPRVGLRNMNCTQYLTWGRFFSSQLKPFNPNVEFMACGHPGIELHRPGSVKKNIVFLLNTNPNGLFSGLDYFHSEFWELLSWTAEEFCSWKIIVRPHPNIPLATEERQQLESFANVTVQDPGIFSLAGTLIDCDLAITVSSSAVIEAVSYGAVPFILNPAPWNFQPNFDENKCGFECKTIAAAKDALCRVLDNPDMLQDFRSKLFAFRESLFDCAGEESLTKMASVLIDQLRFGNAAPFVLPARQEGE